MGNSANNNKVAELSYFEYNQILEFQEELLNEGEEDIFQRYLYSASMRFPGSISLFPALPISEHTIKILKECSIITPGKDFTQNLFIKFNTNIDNSIITRSIYDHKKRVFEYNKKLIDFMIVNQTKYREI